VSGGATGPAGPQGPPGEAAMVSVSCVLLSDNRTIVCTVTPVDSALRNKHHRATIRLAGTHDKSSRTGRGKVRVRLRNDRRVSRSTKVVVEVRMGRQTARIVIPLGRTARASLGR
jgi:hypothetical protein